MGYEGRQKAKVCNAAVTSTLLYEAGTWTRKESPPKRLESVQYCLARRMLGVKPTDHVRMTKAYEILGMTSLGALLNSAGCGRYQVSKIFDFLSKIVRQHIAHIPTQKD